MLCLLLLEQLKEAERKWAARKCIINMCTRTQTLFLVVVRKLPNQGVLQITRNHYQVHTTECYKDYPGLDIRLTFHLLYVK